MDTKDAKIERLTHAVRALLWSNDGFGRTTPEAITLARDVLREIDPKNCPVCGGWLALNSNPSEPCSCNP